MTTIYKLSEELLIIIFEHLKCKDLTQCQKVCRSWYYPAHVRFLNEITLDTSLAIKSFIESIDNNPNKSYLNAVKKIMIGKIDVDDTQLDQDIVEKLFFRFKNIKKIHTYIGGLSLFKDFSDCESLIKACPKLESCTIVAPFYESRDRTKYFEIAWKLRQIMTRLDLIDRELVEQFGDAGQFLSGFPRLKEVATWEYEIENFGEILSAFEHLTNLTTIVLRIAFDDDEAFAERYLSTRPKDVQDLIMQRLSNIEFMKIGEQDGFPVNSIRFIDKYMTGLKTFELGGIYFDHYWTELERQTIYDTLTNVILSAKRDACAHLLEVNFSDVSAYLPLITRKLFQQPNTTSTATTLQFILDEECYDIEKANVRVVSDSFEQSINIRMSTGLSVHDFSTYILDKTTTLDGIDEFILEIQNRDSKDNNTREVTTDTYDAILDKLPSVKEVTLTVPLSYKEKDSTSTSTYSKVEDVTLRSIPDICIQKLLNRYSFAFPNMKRLTLHHFSGVWNEDAGEYRVDLPSCTLERLEIDVTPVTNKTFKYMKEKFFIIVVDTGKHNLYKVPIALSSISRVEESDLDGLIKGEDYIQLYVTVATLTRLEVRGVVDPEDEVYYYNSKYSEDYDLDIADNFEECGITLNTQ